MKNKLFFLLLFSAMNFFGQKTNNKIKFSNSDFKKETYILNLYQIDTLKLKGSWTQVENKEQSHFITIKDSIITLEFFPYPKKERKYLKPGMSKPRLLKTFVNNQANTWNYLNLKYEILKSNTMDYTIIKFKDTIALLGIKGENTFYLNMNYDKKIGYLKEVNDLIYFFEKTLLL